MKLEEKLKDQEMRCNNLVSDYCRMDYFENDYPSHEEWESDYNKIAEACLKANKRWTRLELMYMLRHPVIYTKHYYQTIDHDPACPKSTFQKFKEEVIHVLYEVKYAL